LIRFTLLPLVAPAPLRKANNAKNEEESSLEIIKGKRVSIVTPEKLLGPLNEVEKKFAPPLLYVAGEPNWPLPRPRVAIVGSREASTSGLETASKIATTLAKSGVVVVSGLARGIDSAAHVAAMDGGGKTIAVLGTPLDRAYPPENRELQNTIMRDHWAISQFAPSHSTLPRDFILRNRTMALISNASVIVQAGETSGSLSQGWEALRLGRPLYIWKSLMENQTLKWPKEMVRYGAVKLNNPKAILECLPPRESVISVTR